MPVTPSDFREYDWRPVILGGDITAYSLVRTFYEAYRVKPIVANMSTSGPIALSRLCDHLYYEGFDTEPVLVRALLEIGRQYGAQAGKRLLVLGSGDWYVRMLVENKHVLSDYYVIPYIDRDLLDRIVLKDVFYGTLDELGIPYPRTFVYDVATDTPLDFDLGTPIVAKPANSAKYHYASFPGKRKVFILDTADELKQVLANVRTSSYDYKFLIQEFIPGDDTNMRVLTCYSDRDARVRFASLGHTLLEEHVPSAIGNPCAIITERNDEIVAQATRFLEHIGYTGFSNFDLKYDPRDDTFKFFEINVRLGRSNYYVTAGGHNVAEWMVRDLLLDEAFDGMVVADREHLFTFVPKYVIWRFVRDEAMRNRAMHLYRTGAWSDPQRFGPDLTLRRRGYNALYLANQARKFHRHLEPRGG
jgi:D-aspartate ligase